jgi:hypothetical protein
MDTLVTDPQAETTTEAETQTEAPSWFWDAGAEDKEGVAGNGDKPEWLKSSKYKSVAEQAKAYTELEKKFGAFTGAPEAYELPEDAVVDTSDPMYSTFMEIGKKHGMNNEMFTETVTAIAQLQQEQAEARMQQEMKALGNNADYRLKNISDWAQSRLGVDEFDALKDMLTSAKSVEVIEKIMKQSMGTKIADESKVIASPTLTKEKIKEMQFAKDEFGNRKMNDPEYRKQFNELVAKMS